MATSWYYTRAGEQQGPVEFADLQQMAGAGMLQPTDLVWNEGMPQWANAASVAGLFAESAPYAGVVPIGGPVAPLAYYTPSAQQVVYAGFWLRFVAAFVDGLLLMIILFVVIVIERAVFALGDASPGAAANQNPLLAFVLNLVNIVIIWLYFAKQESGPKRATPGKSLLGLQVTDLNGQRIGFGRATGRFFGKYISEIILFIGFMMAGFTERKQALHDIMAGCLVIKSGKVRIV
jgi:uncharacterized RDD family membrane protein YckC